MVRMFVIGLLLGVASSMLGLIGPAVADAACGIRIRKSYDRLTLDERRLYRRALQLAMDRGHYIKFVEMHTERMSEMEAHRVCMFTYWHRYFLLGFENMLRSLGPEFECITVPYWDEMQHNARFLANVCNNMEHCAPIVRDMGGSSSGPFMGITINGAYVAGDRCVNSPPLSSFCESSSRTGSACARCLPRGNLQRVGFPSATSFASVYRQVFTSGAFVSTGQSVEEGMHNSLHAIMGGAMATFQSPSDPLFWSHHAYVDLLLTIYLRCRVGLGRLTDDQKKNNPHAFVRCPHREDPGFFTSDSTVTMRAGEFGIKPVQVNTAGQSLFPFFRNVPSRYYQLADITQLGDVRYTYQIGGLVGMLGMQCDASMPVRRRLESSHLRCKTDLDDGHDADAPESEASNTTLTGEFYLDDDYDKDDGTVKVQAWVDDVRQALQARDPAITKDDEARELEKMICMFYETCRGGIHDYSDTFKRAFNVTAPPPCKPIVDAIKAANSSSCAQLRLPDWKERTVKYFPCDPSDGAHLVGGN
ncbi:hypothetical protein ATCC90586_004281 [Pythium insidiosum]|nr:hypothetical protein ATCC90586_004281 [Pythium insidiosum]